MRRTMVALVVMFSLVSVPAFAERLDNYAAVKLGVYSPRSYFLKGEGFSNGFDGELAFGHYFIRNLAGEVGLGYFKTATNGSDQITVYPLTDECHDIVDRFSCHDIVDTRLLSVKHNRIRRSGTC